MANPGIDAVSATLATTTAGTAILADATFAVFSVVGQPWGTINDVTFAASGLLAGALVWRLRAASGTALASIAVVGGVVVAVGSGLVISGATGWLLAGFVGTLGFGLIGPAVIAVNSGLTAGGSISPRLGRVGRIAGWAATLGLTAALPVALRIDDAATAPWWAWLTMAGWLGGAILIPAWAFGLGRVRRGGSTPRLIDPEV